MEAHSSVHTILRRPKLDSQVPGWNGEACPLVQQDFCVPGMYRKWYGAAHSEPWALPSFFPGFMHLLAGILVFGPCVAGSLVFGMLSLGDALDFSGSRGNLVLCRIGPSVSESEKGQAARAFSSQRQGSWIHLVLKGVFSSSDWKGP